MLTWTARLGFLASLLLLAASPVWGQGNLLVNGDFSQGNVGFTNDYTYSANSCATPATYTVGTNPNLCDPTAPSFADRTSGSGSMLILKKGPTSGFVAWQETVPVKQGTRYLFQGWMAYWDIYVYNNFPVNLQVQINGVAMEWVTPDPDNSRWTPFSVEWDSQSATSANIAILHIYGGSFALDDLSFAPAAIGIDPNGKTVTTSNLFVAWHSGPDTEAIETLQWKAGTSVTNPGGVGDCANFSQLWTGNGQYTGGSWTFPDPRQAGLMLVGGGSTTPPGTAAWTGQTLGSGTSQVTINSSSTGCNSSAGINVQTTYDFFNPSDPSQNSFQVQRTFDFTNATFAYDFRPYMPSFNPISASFGGGGLDQVLYPTTSGTLAALRDDSCGSFGCTGPIVVPGTGPLNPPWDSTQGWFAIHNPGTLQGVVIKRNASTDPQGNPITAQPFVSRDLATQANDSSFLLVSPPGGFTGGLVTETETLCFYDSTIWTPSLIPPAECSTGPVTFSSSALSFNIQLVNTTSAPQGVTLKNTGSAALTISSIAVTGTNSSDFIESDNCPTSPSTVAVGATCTITVTFLPTAIGMRAASVTMTDDATTSPQIVPMTGTGRAPAPFVSLSANSLAFGTHLVNTTSSPQTVTLKNYGDAPLTITSIMVTGTNSDDFAESNTCPISPWTLSANSTCTITVNFAPTEGLSVNASVNIFDDSANGSPQVISLTGAVLYPVLSYSGNLDFGFQGVGTTGPAHTVYLYSSSTGALTIFSITSSGSYAVSNHCPISPSTLPSGGACNISISFAPTSTGFQIGTVTITSNSFQGPLTIMSLTGAGGGPPSLSASVKSKIKAGTLVTLAVSFKNVGTNTAQNTWLNQIILRTLGGTGTVAYVGPSLPDGLGILGAGTSSTATLQFSVPATVTKFSITESGNLQDLLGDTYSFSLAQVVYP
jgi:hypothetical protein